MAEPVEREGPPPEKFAERRLWGEDQVVFFEGSGVWLQADKRIVENLDDMC